MSILIQSREPAAPPLPDRDVLVWDVKPTPTTAGLKNAVVVEQRPGGYYVVSGPLLFPDDPFASKWLNASTDAGAIAEARGHVVAAFTRRAEENMALANAFAADGEPVVTGGCGYAQPSRMHATVSSCDPDDPTTVELDQAEVAAAIAVALGELRTAYPAGV